MELVKCKRGPIIITVSSTNSLGATTNFSGNVILERNLCNIIAFRILYANVTQTSGNSLSLPLPQLWAIESFRLGAQLSKNPFQVGVAVDSSLQSVSPITSIIGMTTMNNTAQEIGDQMNGEMRFCKTQQIDRFDWSMRPLQNAVVSDSPYCVNLAIAFYPACDCNPF